MHHFYQSSLICITNSSIGLCSTVLINQTQPVYQRDAVFSVSRASFMLKCLRVCMLLGGLQLMAGPSLAKDYFADKKQEAIADMLGGSRNSSSGVLNVCPLSGGAIGSDETFCGAYDPALILNITSATSSDFTGASNCCQTSGYSKPKQLVMMYTGQDCSATNTTQSSSQWSCSGNPNFAASVYIVANNSTNPASAPFWFTGTVALNGSFTVDAANGGASQLGTNTYFYIYSHQGGTLLQTVRVHTSCSGPIVPGQQWGSMFLLSTAGQNNANCGSTDAGLTYQWQYREGTSGPWIDIPGATGASYDPPLITTTTQYRRAALGGASCNPQYSNIVTKTVTPGVVINLTGNTDLCAGESTTLTAQIISGVGPYTYAWSNGSTTSSITVSPSATTTYSVTVTGGNGCFAVASATVTIGGLVSGGVIGYDQTQCGGYDPALIVSLSDAIPAGQGSSGQDCCAANSKPNELLMQYTGDGCGATNTVQASGKWSCENFAGGPAGSATVYIIANTSTSPTSGTQYFAGTVSLGSAFVVSTGSSSTFGSNTYFHIFSSQGGTLLQRVGVHTSCSTPIVVGDQWGSMRLLSTSHPNGNTCGFTGGNASYQWQSREGTSGPWVDIPGATGATYDPPFITTTTQYRRMAMGAGNCPPEFSNIVTKTVTPGVVLNLTGNTDLCAGESTTLTAQIVSGVGPYTYAWSNGSNSSSITVSPSATTTYSVTVTGGNGCFVVASATVTIGGLVSGGVIGYDQTQCGGYDPALIVSLSDAIPAGQGSSGQDCCAANSKPNELLMQYTGDGCGATNTVQASGKWSCDDFAGGPAGSATVYIIANTSTSPTSGTQYFAGTVSLGSAFVVSTGSSSTFGSNTYFHIFSSQGGTLLQRVGVHTSCSTPIVVGDQWGSMRLLSTSHPNGNTCGFTGGNASYQWQSREGTSGPWVDIPGATGATYDPPFITTTTQYRRMAMGAGNCPPEFSNIVTKTVTPGVVLNLTGNTDLCAGESTTLTAQIVSGVGPYTYAWSNGSNSSSITVSPSATTTYSVTVTGGNGCFVVASATVTIGGLVSGGVIGYDQTQCGGYDPALIVSLSDAIPAGQGSSGQDCCAANSKPNELLMQYTGDGCGATNTVQASGKWSCDDFAGGPAGSGTVYIIANTSTSPTSGTQYFAGTVSLGSAFVVSTGSSSTFGSNTYFHIFSSQGGTLLQRVGVHTSCSTPIVVGDQWGSMRLLSTSHPNGNTCGFTGGNASYQWQSREGTSGPWVDIPGATGATYDPPFITTTTQYRRMAMGAGNCPPEFSNIVTKEVTPGVTVQIGGNTQVCIGNSTTLTANIISGVGPYTYLWSTGANTPSISVSPTTTTSYSVTVTGANACSAVASATVEIGGMFSGGTIGFEQDNCTPYNPQEIIELSPAVGAGGSFGQNCCSSVSGDVQKVLMLYTGGGCSATSTVQPSSRWSCADFNGGPSGSPSVYIIANDNSNPASGRIWFTGTVLLNGTFLIDALNAGENKLRSDTYIHIFTQQGGTLLQRVHFHTSCSQPVVPGDQWGASMLLQVYGATGNVCGGSTIGFTYQWQRQDATTGGWVDIPGATGQNYDPPFITQTTQYRRLAYNGTFCPPAISNVVEKRINILINVNAGNDVSLCAGESTVLTASASGGLAPYNFSWSNGLGSGSTQIVSPMVTTTYTVTVTDALGCSNTDQVTVTVNENPMVDAGPDLPICVGESAALVAVASGGDGNYVFSWDNGLGSGPAHTVAPTQTTTYSVTLTDGNGCFATDMVTVIVYPLPMLTIVEKECEPGNQFQTYYIELVTASGNTLTASEGMVEDRGDGEFRINAIPVGLTVTITITQGPNDCEASFDIDSPDCDCPAIPAPVSAGDQEVCAGDAFPALTVTEPAAGYIINWYDAPFGGNLLLAGSTSFTPLAAGTYYAQTEELASGCKSDNRTAVSLTVNPLPISDAGDDEAICLGQSTVLAATATGGSGGYQFDWDNGLGAGTSHSVSPAMTTIYTVTVTDSKGCMDTDEVTITVHPNPVADAGNDAEICEGEEVILTASATGGDGNYAYEWDNGLGTGASHTVNPSSTTTYMVTVTDGNGCFDTDEVTVVVNDRPMVDPGADIFICLGESNTLSASATGGDGNYSFLWDNGLGSGASHVVNPSSSTIYGVTVTDGNGCTDEAFVIVTVGDNPQVGLGPNQQICAGESITLTASVSGSNPPFTYSWSAGLGDAPSHIVSPLATTVYGLTVTDDNGCIGTASIEVIVNDNPIANAGPDAVICIGESTLLTASATGGDDNYVFEWDNGLGFGPSHTVSPVGTTEYTVTVTDGKGCTDESTVNVTVVEDFTDGGMIAGEEAQCGPYDPAPILGTTDPSGCAAALPEFQWQFKLPADATWTDIPGANGSDYDPSFITETTEYRRLARPLGSSGAYVSSNVVVKTVHPEPIVDVTATFFVICVGESTELSAEATGGTPGYSYAWDNGLGSGATQVVSPLATTTYAVTATDANACIAINEITILVNPNPIANAGDDVEICAGASAALSASATGGSGGYTFTWDNGLGSGAGQQVSPAVTTTYTVTVTDANGCEDTDMVTVVVNPNPIADAGPDVAICEGGSTTLAASATGGGSGYAYFWDNGLGSGASHGVSPTVTTVYTVTVTDNNGCEGTDEVVVTVNDNPIADAGSDALVCVGESTTLTASAIGGDGNYTFAWDNGLGAGDIQIVSPLSTTTYTVTVTDGNGCVATDFVTVAVVDRPTVDAGPDVFACEGTSITLTASAADGAGNYVFSWDNSLGNGATQLVSPVATTTYTVTVTDGNGCTDTDQVTVQIEPELQVSITPSSAALCVGGVVMLSANLVGGTGENCTIQWQSSPDGLGAWADIAGANAVTYAPSSTLPGAFFFRVIYDCDSCIPATSNTAAVSITEDPSVVINPPTNTVCVGGNLLLLATLNGGTGSCALQWQSSLDANTWSDISGANALALAPPTGVVGTFYYRAVYNCDGLDCDEAISNVATVIIAPDPEAEITPSNPVVCLGGNLVLNLSTFGGAGVCSIQWQSSPDGLNNWANINGATSASYGPSTAAIGTFYYRAIYSCSGGGCETATSNTAMVMVVEDPALAIDVNAEDICEGGSAELTAMVSGGGGCSEVQWQTRPGTSGPWSDVGTGSTLNTPTDLAAGAYQYRALLNCDGTGCDDAVSNIVILTVHPNPAVTISTDVADICVGGSTTLMAQTSGGVACAEVQWQTRPGTSGIWMDAGSGSTLATPTDLAVGTYQYRALYNCAADGCEQAVSDIVTLTVHPDPQVSISPEDVIVCVGGSSTLTAIVSGGAGTCSIQWQSSASPSGPWADIPGADGDVFSMPTDTEGTFYYRAVYECGADGCAAAASNVATVVVEPGPQVNITPANSSVCVGAELTLSANVSGGVGNCTFQWQSSVNEVVWSNIAGANSATYRPPTTSPSTRYYRIIYNCSGSGCGQVISNTATVIVRPDPAIGITPTSATLCVGGMTTLTANVTGGTGTCLVQWQSSPDGLGGWADISGAVGNTFSPPSDVSGALYYRAVYECSADGCNSATSNTALVVVIEDPSITINPPTSTVCVGGNLTLLATLNGGAGTCTLQWQSSPDGLAWANISGANSIAFNPPTGVAGTTYYRATYTCTGSGCDPATSNVAAVVVEPSPEATVTPADPIVCVGANLALNVSTTGGAGVCSTQWQSSPNGQTWTNINGATSTSFSPSTAAVGTFYYRVIYTCTGGNCLVATSNVATVIVVPDPAISIIADASETCEKDETATLTSNTSGGVDCQDVIWESRLVGTMTWLEVGTGNTYTTASPLAPGQYEYRARYICAGEGCNDAVSNIVTITVQPVGSIGNFVWEDLNYNGLQDSGEPGIANVTVRLLDENGTFIDETMTDADGFYLFDQLCPGNYIVEFMTPGGFFPTVQLNTDGKDPLDSDADPVTGRTGIIPLAPGENDLTNDAGFYRSGSIGDFVWEDANGNGVQGASEPGIAGVEVSLAGTDGAGNLVNLTTTTDADGFYEFTGLAPGTYTVTFGAPMGYEGTAQNQGGDDTLDSDADPLTGQTAPIVLASGENNPTIDAGFYRAGSIGDFVWEDQNGDGIQDAGEPGIAGVEVSLAGTDGAGNPVNLTTTTDADGFYEFAGLAPGTYTVTFGAPMGYEGTAQNQGGDDTLDSDADPLTGQTAPIVLASGENNPTIDAGFYRAGSIGDFVWEDQNGDGIQDAGEPGIAGVEVSLAGTDGAGNPVNLTTTTDADGFYEFTGLAPGTYTVAFGTPAGFIGTAQDQGMDDTADSDADPLTGQAAPVTLASGENNPTIDAGFYRAGRIGDFVWDDLDGDGIQDAGEPGIAGVTVSLTGTDGAGNPVSLTTTTDADGFYEFTGLAPGTYVVAFGAPAGYEGTAQNQGGDDTLDSDADPLTGQTAPIVLASGENNPTIDAGFYRAGSIGDFVWEDQNGDGIQDAGEPGIAGVEVSLAGTDGAGNPVNLTTTTDADGFYEFAGLAPGTYTVTFGAPMGYEGTAQNQGGDDTLDSDADPLTGQTAPITLASGENNPTIDAGFYRPASLGDFVWEDLDADGIQDAGEPGIPGVTVSLTSTDGAGNPVSLTTTTDADGFYEFTGLAPGTYTVAFGTPAGYEGTAQNQGGDDALDSDADPLTGETAPITLASGENNPDIDAGFYRPASLGDFVWEDLDADGIQDAGEPGIPGVTVSLAGTDGAGNPVNLATTTDADGFYEFAGLAPGTYTVTFGAPMGYEGTAQNQGGDDTLDSDADPLTGQTAPIVLASGENNPTIDAGFYRAGSIGDFVWEDQNGDGIQDVGEPGIAGVEVSLAGTDGAGNPVNLTTTTDADGFYEFAGLAPGTYTVTFGAPMGYEGTAQNQGGDGTFDSDADPLTGQTAPIVLASGENNPDIDAGFYRPASLGDFVWEDLNADGIQDAGEPGIAGVIVSLYFDADQDGTPDGAPIAATTTGPNGEYSFTGLAPGNYIVGFATPTGYLMTLFKQGGDDTVDSDVNPNGLTNTITLESGENNPDIDAGFFRTASLGDFVWEDLNGNGQQDANEPGIDGVEVNLLDGMGNSTGLSTVTMNGGFYEFTNLTPGDYIVEFVKPDGYEATLLNVGPAETDSDADPVTGRTAVVTLQSGEVNNTIDAGFSRYDLALTKELAATTPGPFQPGSIIEFDITVINEGGLPAANIEVTDRAPMGLDIIGFDALGSNPFEIGNGVYGIPSLPVGQSVTFRVITQISATFQGFSLTNVAEITADDGEDKDSTPDNNDPDEDDQDEVFIPIGQTASVSIEKATNGKDADTFDGSVIIPVPDSPIPIIQWTYTVQNTGTLDLTHVVVFDDKEGTVCTIPLLAAGDQATCNASAPAILGHYSNLATVEAQPIDAEGNDFGPTVTDTDPSNYIGVYINVEKLANKTEICAGETVNFTLTVRMLGGAPGVQLRDISVNDTNLPITLEPGGTYWVGGDDNGNGSLDFGEEFIWAYSIAYDQTTTNMAQDQATIWFNDINTGLVVTGSDEITITVNEALCASIGDFVWNDYNADGIQDSDEPGIEGVVVNLIDSNGDVVATTSTDNTGFYEFTGVIPDDYTVEFVAPAGFAGSPQNVGMNDDIDSDPNPNTGITDPFTIVNSQVIDNIDAGFYGIEPAIELVKTGVYIDNPPLGLYNPGDEITYTFTVANTGNTRLTNVTITDPLITVSGGPITLNPGQSDNTTFTGIYVITQADIDNGSFTNIATATGTPPLGDDVDDSDDDTQFFQQNPSIALTKSASPQAYSAAGDQITYTFTVENDGNVTLTDVTVVDPLFNLSFGPITLAPGASEEYTYIYTVTQADVDAGSIYNVATATGTDPNDEEVTDEDDETVTAEQDPSLALTKSASPQTYAAAGDQITYTFTVENDGNVTLTDVTVVDPLFGLSFGPVDLAPGASEVYTYTYTVTQADVDAGSIYNVATATGKDPNDNPVEDEDDETVTAEQDPSLALTKSASPQAYSAAGDQITYTFTVENDGNVTLTDVTVVDPLFGLSFGPITLAPGASEVYTYTYTVTQADVDAGSIYNVATATGTDPNGDPVTDEDDETVTAEQDPSLALTKSASPQAYSAAGDQITYTFTVENDGNVTLTDVTVVDPLFNLSFGPIDLAPGASEVYTYTYTVTQADVDAGSIYNVATATGTDPNGEEVTDEDDETVTAEQDPSLALTKSASPQTYAAAGDQITYTFTVENDGNVTLTDVTVVDPLFGLSFGPITLAPGASEEYTYIYTVTQADVDAGSIYNVATATGTDPNDNPVEDEDDETVTAEQDPSLALTKSASPQAYSAAGDQITYTFTVENDGNVTLTDVTVVDPLFGLSFGPIDLAPGESEVYTYTYTVTQADVDAGSIYNVATATGTDPNDDPVTDEDDETVTAEQDPSLALTKSASPQAYSAAGDQITYTFTVENDGNVTLTDVTVVDPLFGLSFGPIDLAPGASEVYTYTYTVTQADVDAGSIYNVATATGTDPNDDPVRRGRRDGDGGARPVAGLDEVGIAAGVQRCWRPDRTYTFVRSRTTAT
jgi:uncharacterized repeat protein (TIGR01451 family)